MLKYADLKCFYFKKNFSKSFCVACTSHILKHCWWTAKICAYVKLCLVIAYVVIREVMMYQHLNKNNEQKIPIKVVFFFWTFHLSIYLVPTSQKFDKNVSLLMKFKITVPIFNIQSVCTLRHSVATPVF